jgi:hypothetical protein
MSAFTPKANIGPQSLHVRFGSKANICAAKSHVRFTPESGHVRCKQECPLRARSGHGGVPSGVREAPSFPAPAEQSGQLVIAQLLFFTGAEKPHREPHCIARKPSAWRLSGIREYCLDPRRRLDNAAPRLCHTCAQHCSPTRRILRKVFLGSFGGTRACCLRALVLRCTVV